MHAMVSCAGLGLMPVLSPDAGSSLTRIGNCEALTETAVT